MHDGILLGDDLQAVTKIIPGCIVPVPLDKFGLFGENFNESGTGVHYLDDVLLEGTDKPVGLEGNTWTGVEELYH